MSDKSVHPPAVLRWPYAVVPGLHLLAALSGPAYYLLAVAPYGFDINGSPDANIGAGLAIGWTAVWGLPWSIWPLRVENIDSPEPVLAAFALLNVALVAAVAWWLYRSSVRRGTPTGTVASPRVWHYAVVPVALLVSVLAGPFAIVLIIAGWATLGPDVGLLLIAGDVWAMLLGLPWSLATRGLLVPFGSTVAALVNVALISLGFRAAYRRKRRQAQRRPVSSA